ncbi:helix-turn-helix domain-containing protein [Micromonospora orduensis]|uniref:Helix-turn-helix domain-containing protein n=1 Tax=Micromonospora orduensis TaxID=1420891 RepID=A0A5C4QCG2_9ACTN|nr:helix-turn-helix domain-containing protein [Micromonospora orduensis]TNH23969.1 helix-turn-helix domain-containing protein [Micromonospora orduensis]
MKTQIEPGWLSLPDAATYTGLTERTLRDRIGAGQLRAFRANDKPGSHYRIRRSDLDAMFEANPAQSAAR